MVTFQGQGVKGRVHRVRSRGQTEMQANQSFWKGV